MGCTAASPTGNHRQKSSKSVSAARRLFNQARVPDIFDCSLASALPLLLIRARGFAVSAPRALAGIGGGGGGGGGRGGGGRRSGRNDSSGVSYSPTQILPRGYRSVAPSTTIPIPSPVEPTAMPRWLCESLPLQSPPGREDCVERRRSSAEPWELPLENDALIGEEKEERQQLSVVVRRGHGCVAYFRSQ
ncbi:unnamed protein product [Lampetra fluviatilis]